MEFTGQYSLRKKYDSSGDSVPEITSSLWLKMGLKKAGLFLVSFAICILGLMYKDLANPIVDSSRATLSTAETTEEITAKVYSSSIKF